MLDGEMMGKMMICWVGGCEGLCYLRLHVVEHYHGVRV